MLQRAIKRIFDVFFSIFVLITLSPFFLLIAFAIKRYDGGPVFADFPERFGRNGRRFFMYKFRSMCKDAHEIIQTDPKYKDLKKKWKVQEKLDIEEDPRITPIGKIIRRCDIDELPQFLNVLKGDMSVIGPRPFFVDQLERYVKEYNLSSKWEVIQTVKPGITGLWQVNGRNRNTIPQRFDIDMKYIKNWSILLDIKIFFKTPIEIIRHTIYG